MQMLVYTKLLAQCDVEEASRLLSVTFSTHEPVTRTMQLTAEEFLPFARSLCEAACDEGLGMTVREVGTDKLLAVHVATDTTTEPRPFDTKGKKEQWEPIFGLLAAANTAASTPPETPRKKGQVMHIHLSGVDPALMSSGLGTLVGHANMINALQRGFTEAKTEATNPASWRRYEKMGFEPAHRIAYSTYTDAAGRRPFETLKGSDELRVMQSKLERVVGFQPTLKGIVLHNRAPA
eukprot:TRINITY_DN25525_c0_g1_i1.p1 TRINITY_DN25525_c0_g1~~TRINITY_DN25525_c0_g1_i1.p1  ORF type:complete len:236 (-),score=49.67 TRINITY_DN25525_c0_g1_i1:109-816(-)